ncbi:hypothetical protein F5X96DRAFT_619132 [Biscogniauxia mediterranea]|nr:hypothetical protein F5X96DRAFT_619132 [Biscogniauxia mediterranea]
MAVDWGMAAVAAALAMFIVPYAAKLLKTAYKAFWGKPSRHIRLKWDDIPDGKIHQCLHPYTACNHPGPHEHGKECWSSAGSLGPCFNRAWDLSTRKPQYAKPFSDALPSESSFLCTDAKTVLAFVLYTVDRKKASSWYPKGLSFNETRVDVETLNGCTVAHIRGPFRTQRQTLTKSELECMLSGYPPWYRETFVTRANIEVPFPISTHEDVSRAGWIIAVGLMDGRLDSQTPVALYRCLDEPDEPQFRQNGRIFRQAVARCRDHIQEHILPHFPGNQDIADAIRALNWLVERFTGSGMPEGGLGRSPGDSSRILPHLKYSDCRFVCQNFNEYRELNNSTKMRLEPIVYPAMAAAVHGAYSVVQYLKDDGMELKIPPEFLPLDREVWLKDCVTRLPLK